MSDILLAAAVLPPVVLMVMIYRMDKVEKEPVGLIFKLIFLGVLSCIPAVFGEEILGAFFESALPQGTMLYLVIENFIGVALVEEGCKYVMLKKGSWNHPAFDYSFDGIVYSVAVTLGFAGFENILYVAEGGMGVAMMRGVLSVPGHCIFGIFMGIYYGMAKKYSNEGMHIKAAALRKKAIIIPMLLHGFYDFCLSTNSEIYTVLFFAFVVVVDIIAIIKIRKAEKEDTHL